jgi:formamidopyrimidine-DNA glycosylase
MVGDSLTGIRLSSPFVLRSIEPTISEISGRKIIGLSRPGKRIVTELEDELFVVTHLMIAGRFRWYKSGNKIPGRLGLMTFDLNNGTLVLTDAGQKHRASVHLVKRADAL